MSPTVAEHRERTDSAVRGCWPAVAALSAGLFLAVVSTTVVSVALPSIGRSMHATPTQLEWVVDAYVLVYASLLVAGGVLGDRYGRKGAFLLGVGLFGCGSLLTGLAPTMSLLLVGRVIQGLGPALLVPGSLTIIRATITDSRRRALAIGLWSMSSGLALAVGPVLGGVVVGGLGWRWVFLVNVPLSAALLLAACRVVPRIPGRPMAAPFDWVGAVLVTIAVAALALGVIDGFAPAYGVAALSVAAFVVLERRRGEPLVDLRLFRRPEFVAANLAALAVFFSFVGAIVYFSAYFQQVQGRSPITAGVDICAIGVAFALAAPISGRLTGRLGPRPPMFAGLLVAAAASFGLVRLDASTGIAAIWWNFAVLGAGVGLCLTPMTAIAVSTVDASRAGMASAVHNALRQVGQVLGVAVLGTIVYHGGDFVAGLHRALWVCGATLVGAAAISAVLVSVGSQRRRAIGHEA